VFASIATLKKTRSWRPSWLRGINTNIRRIFFHLNGKCEKLTNLYTAKTSWRNKGSKYSFQMEYSHSEGSMNNMLGGNS
jgi:hypothetical protein